MKRMMINWNKASDEREETYHHETDPKMNQNGKAWKDVWKCSDVSSNAFVNFH